MNNRSKNIKPTWALSLCIVLLLPLFGFTQNNANWHYELNKLETLYEYGKYHQAKDHAKSLLKKVKKKKILKEFELPTQALYLKYQAALGMRLQSDSILDITLIAWDSITSYESDSLAIMGNYAMALASFSFDRNKKADQYLKKADSYLSSENDSLGYWKQRIQLAQIQVYLQTMNYVNAENIIDSVIQYQEQQIAQITNFGSTKKRSILFNSDKKEFIKQAKKLGLLLVLRGDIFLEKGDVNTASKIYTSNDTLLLNLVNKKDISILFNTYGKARVSFLQGHSYSSLELNKIRKKYAENVKYSIPNLTYFRIFETEIRSNIIFENHRKYIASAQQYQRESVKNYSNKSTHNFHAKYLFNLSYLNNKKFEVYKKQMSKLKSTSVKFYSEMDPAQVPFLYDLALSQTYTSDYFEAHKTYNDIVKIIDYHNSDSSGLYYQANLELGSFYLEYTTNYAAADSIYNNYFKVFVTDGLETYHPSYPRFLQVYAQIKTKKDLFEEALNMQLLSSQIQLQKSGLKSYNYAKSLQQLGRIQLKMGQYFKAEKNLLQSIQTFETFKNINPEPYIQALKDYSKILSFNGYNQKAIKKLEIANSLSTRLSLNKTRTIAQLQDELASVYSQQEKYQESEILLISNLKRKHLSKELNDESLIRSHYLLAELYLKLKRNYESRLHIDSAMTLSKGIYDEHSLVYLQNKTLLANWYAGLHEYKTAMQLYKTIIIEYTNKFGKDYLGIADLIVRSITISINEKNFDPKFYTQLDEARVIISKNVNSQHPAIGNIVELKAQLYVSQKEFEKALIQLKTANLLYGSLYGNTDIKTANNYLALGNIYHTQKNHELAITNYKEGAAIYLNILGESHILYAKSLSKIGQSYYANQQKENALVVLKKSISIYKTYLSYDFYQLSEKERYDLWKEMKITYNLFNAVAVDNYHTNPSVLSNMYDNKIRTKSILLRSSLQFKNRVNETGNYKLISQFNTWENYKIDHVKLIASERTIENKLDELIPKKQAYMDHLERNLILATDSLINNHSEKQYKWVNIKNQLKSTDAAIEIIRVQYRTPNNVDSIVYVGLVITKETKNNPEGVILSNGNDLEGKYYNYYRNSLKNNSVDQNSYSQYWEYIDAKCKYKFNIYYSGEGVYNQINPETFKPIGTPYLLYKYTFHFISNTHQIIKMKKRSRLNYTDKSIALFGNPNFGKTNEFLSPLPGTKKEVNNLQTLFRSYQWTTEKFLGKRASEQSLQQLQNPRILHIATHGYFLEDPEKFDLLTQKLSTFAPVVPLLTTGLFLSTESTINTENITAYFSNNGVLTALEASNLNLENTELVFLSACETGRTSYNIGTDISSLQHAFRIAGANNIIMTLFKVDDKITQELVHLFYSEWLRNGNMINALNHAKKTISSKYNNPMYWGAFILVSLN